MPRPESSVVTPGRRGGGGNNGVAIHVEEEAHLTEIDGEREMMMMSALEVCHIVAGDGSRPIWICSEIETTIRDLHVTLCEFVDRHDTSTQV
jgi:hypothetical protein